MTNFTVRQGCRYRATLTLGMLESLASNTMIASKLEDAGFAEVSVEGQGSVRQATALWPNGDTSAAMPKQVTSVEEIGAA
ncbi:hypothetical protein [Hyphomicrobium sulfonivorans]|uniref:hypothetical protein n=1 Tax=Hyphomicrobium sulfonivorans TaxID=121290 RepID=UPI00156F1FBD|nr:hypothetical protein [Hyphomicrobium sulfonivorans]MBI1651290.1 hypothetical protein [Hyphomicrobium sulfonivorans]NSL73257.1 hypothetical protein [Hyphomicrobium sulfonivorans]